MAPQPADQSQAAARRVAAALRGPGAIVTALGGQAPVLMLDISRLLSRAGEAVPSGIDKVELAYAEYLAAHQPERTRFAALHPLGAFGVLPFEAACRFIFLLSARWRAGGDAGATLSAARLLHRHLLFAVDRRARGGGERLLYLLLSHHHLVQPAVIARILARPAELVAMLHDTIPSDYPEYARPREPAKHRRRIETVCRLASAVLVPSEVVRQNLLPHLAALGRAQVPVHVVRHGVDPALLVDEPRMLPERQPYFVCLGTIEPRKNHQLLLNIWRRLVELHGAKAPKLILVGRRGWENENIVDMIERCVKLRGVVQEYNALPDRQVIRLLRGARALLMPSFAEGYGLPLAEALALRVPVLCSDIAIFREVGGNVPVYLDPLDGLGWQKMIELYAQAAPAPPDWPAMGWRTSIEASLQKLGVPVPEKTPEFADA